MISVLEWLEGSGLSLFFRQSAWLYPAVEIVHIAGFAVLVGAAFLFDLRLLGFARRLPVSECISHMIHWARLSLIAIVPSGFILFIVDAVSMAANPAFQFKMGFMILAGINAAVFHRFTARSLDQWNVDQKPPPAAAIAGICSIVLWIGVIAGGRLIAYV
jgi:hypothetical protein